MSFKDGIKVLLAQNNAETAEYENDIAYIIKYYGTFSSKITNVI